MGSRIVLDRYVYEDIYPAFKAQTDEKEITANINRTFLNYLARRGLVLTGNDPALVGDIGCGPCDTLIKYLTGVHFPHGFIVKATDYIPEYADAERGEALRNLAAAQASNLIKLVSFAVKAGNAFSGNLLDLLSTSENETTIQCAFHLVFASHVMYHAESSSDVQRLVADIANNILGRDGICIMYHVANRTGTFQQFRARFGSQAGVDAASNTGAVTIDDPSSQIRAVCARLELPLYQGEFVTKLRFGTLRDEEWASFEDPRSYDGLAGADPTAYEDLKRLYFVVQRAPLEFAADRSISGLHRFLDEIRQVIEANHGSLPLAEQIQVFSRSDATSTLSQAVPEALAASLDEFK